MVHNTWFPMVSIVSIQSQTLGTPPLPPPNMCSQSFMSEQHIFGSVLKYGSPQSSGEPDIFNAWQDVVPPPRPLQAHHMMGF